MSPRKHREPYRGRIHSVYGKEMTITEASEEHEVPLAMLRSRVGRGYTLEESIEMAAYFRLMETITDHVITCSFSSPRDIA